MENPYKVALLIVIKHFVSKTRYKKFIKELHKTIKHQAAKSNCYTYDELIRYMHLPNKFEDIANL